jgi:hypothetical protein
MEIKFLNFIGDSNLVIKQVKEQVTCKNYRLKRYKNLVWDTMKLFNALSLEVEMIIFNEQVNALAIVASTLQPCEEVLRRGRMEIIFRPSIFGNFDH